MDNKLKHLEFIQNVIERMNNNSIQLKTWTILLAVGVLALAGKQESWFIMLCAMMPTGLFWLLNIHFLKIERSYRVLYDTVRKKNEKDIDFSMDISNIIVPKKTMPTISCFYLPIMAALLIISGWLYFYS
ncbi:hypothetical protein E4N98_02000 [Treponema denticola]|uniref:Uncharacterized protein n=1 Tax=Treponema denticola (strain ATCC 35405 / DSM 14222 / CIP 103919 / JCM 8153 / KCTC 15104) TaxID=243275 RepID=Q73M90_TREDE|nr:MULTISPECIES: hypothetical protein [Treponema]AAS12136.1 conserved hypothetical protein [Treponema denticola ATCC 35405]UYT09018.1 hypothetical protein OE909_06125 [Treponema denticola]HCY94944.1 hypothetical protein [Treponema sp.]